MITNIQSIEFKLDETACIRQILVNGHEMFRTCDKVLEFCGSLINGDLSYFRFGPNGEHLVAKTSLHDGSISKKIEDIQKELEILEECNTES